MKMKKECLECKKTFHGRTDAKFCCAACRSAFHYRANKEGSEVVKKVNVILKRNRRILADFNGTGKSRVRRQDLIINGFNFSYLTNTYVTRKGKVYKFCYDQGYLDEEGDFLTLVVKKDYVS